MNPILTEIQNEQCVGGLIPHKNNKSVQASKCYPPNVHFMQNSKVSQTGNEYCTFLRPLPLNTAYFTGKSSCNTEHNHK